MINLYNSNTVEFDNNGLANLKDMINCFVTEELNGVFEFEAEYPLSSDYIEQIKNENILKLDIGNDNKQLFRIKKITPNLKTMKIYGQHITYDLKDNNLDDVYPRNQNCNNMGQWILSRTQYEHNFSFFSDIEKIASARYVDVNPLKAIMGEQYNSFLNLFGGEIVRDNFTIKILQNRGLNNGYKLSKTKNITGLEITEDNSSIATRLIPKAYDGIKLPEKYIDSPLINNYPHPYIQEIEFSDVKLKSEESPDDEEAFDTLEELYEELRRRCYEKFTIENIDKPLTNVKVNFVELSKTDVYAKFKNMETLQLGDYVTLKTDNYNIVLQVIKTKYNVLLKRLTEIELGTKKINFVSSTTSNMNNMLSKLNDIDPISILNQAKENATNQITSALGGYTYKTHDEFFIMDTDDPNTARKVWRWNLNGLGYSSNGINGPYELAMTQDGRIVADFITTGHLNTSVIEGYDSLVEQVSKIYEFTSEVEGTGQVIATNGREDALIRLSIFGEIELLYPANDLYPSNDLYPINMNLLLLNSNGNQEIELPISYLYKLGDVSDEFQIYSVFNDETELFDYKARVIRRIEVDEFGNKIIAPTETITELGDFDINFYKGETIIKMSSFDNEIIDVNYYINNDITNSLATKAFVNSSIKQTADTIELEVSKKVGNDEIISKINQSAEQIQIDANKISLEGKEINLTSDNIKIDSDNFSVDENGNLMFNNGEASNLSIVGGEINLKDNAEVSNAVLNIESLDRKHTSRFCSKSISIDSNYGTPNYEEASMSPDLLLINGNKGAFTVFNGATDPRDNYVEYETNGVQVFHGDGYGFSYYNGSLEELKKNIKKNKNGLNLIKNTDIYTFNYKNEDSNHKKHIGVVIGNKYKTPKEILNNNNSGVDTYSMVSVAWHAIKEQQEIIEKLEKRIEVLENEK